MIKKLITRSERETIAYGKKIAATFRGGEVIALSGNLGAGKTTMIKGIAKGLGIKKPVTSPTFIIMNVYAIASSKSQVASRKSTGNTQHAIRHFVHIDCYRIHSEKDILGIGAEEYFGRKDTVVVVEWPERIKKLLKNSRNISLKTLSNGSHVIIDAV